MGMRVDIATLFPEMCQRVLDESILGRAARRGHIETHCHQIRDYTLNRQKQTDDYPYGGGCGMVLYAQAHRRLHPGDPAAGGTAGPPRPAYRVYDGGRPALHRGATPAAWPQYDSLLLVCGHYEGIDERVIEAFADEEISIGDYILTGGELASLVVADSVLRLQPGVLAEQKGYEEESYWNGLLEYPQYTRPEVWEGRAVPSHPPQRQPQGGGRLAGRTEPPAHPPAPARPVGSLSGGRRLGTAPRRPKSPPAGAERSLQKSLFCPERTADRPRPTPRRKRNEPLCLSERVENFCMYNQ